MNVSIKMEEVPRLKTDGGGGDLLPTAVDWLVIFDPLVKKIRYDDKGMWHAYLLVTAATSLMLSREMIQFCVTPLWYLRGIWAGKDGG